MEERKPVFDWNYAGEMDVTVGTGAVFAEKALAYVAGLVLPLLYLYWYFMGHLPWAGWQYVLAGLIGADVGAGAVANSLNSCKRFYHTPRRMDEPGWVGLIKHKLIFAALHVYPLVVAALFGAGHWLYGVLWYALLLLAVVVIWRVPLYLQRPAAVLAVLLAFLLNGYGVVAVLGFEWLAPLLFIKIVLGHVVREEPYRP